MSQVLRTCLAISVIAGSAWLVALADNQPIIGALSLIEIGAKPGAANEGPGRGVLPNGVNNRTADEHAFVEVLQVPRLRTYQSCRASKGTDCNTNPKYAHEWSVPYINEQNSEKLEEGLSRAWNRFDARTLWRMNSLINSRPDPEVTGFSYLRNCGSNGGDGHEVEDPFIDAWNANNAGKINNREFCDDLEPDGAEAYVCDKNGKIKSINWGAVRERFKKVLEYADQKYYAYTRGSYPADYWTEVYATMDKWMPGALDWDGVYDIDRYGAGGGVGSAGGSTISPVYSAQPNTAMYIGLANKAQGIDPRGYDYILQQYRGQGANRKNLKSATGDSYTDGYPGLPKIEALKYDLSDPNRDIFYTNPPRKWSVSGRARPTGSKGLGSMEEQQNVGHATFLRVWGRKDREYSPRSVSFYVKCKKESKDYLISRIDQQGKNVPPATHDLVPGCCEPVKFEKTRAHTDWKSIPEGYQIPNVLGIPVNRDPTKSNGYIPPLN